MEATTGGTKIAAEPENLLVAADDLAGARAAKGAAEAAEVNWFCVGPASWMEAMMEEESKMIPMELAWSSPMIPTMDLSGTVMDPPMAVRWCATDTGWSPILKMVDEPAIIKVTKKYQYCCVTSFVWISGNAENKKYKMKIFIGVSIKTETSSNPQ